MSPDRRLEDVFSGWSWGWRRDVSDRWAGCSRDAPLVGRGTRGPRWVARSAAGTTCCRPPH